MPSGEPSTGPAPSIFVSYASQDRDAARNLRDGLAAAGFDVWYDESELGGGDAWDQKIRRQIRECRYFMPVISANANARHEGYFRREWRLAVERSLDMADDVAFILPVVVDSTTQQEARVPDKFVAVQWLSLAGGRATPAFDAWCRRLLGGEDPASAASKARPAVPQRGPVGIVRDYPPFPEQKPGQKLHFLFMVVGWALRTAWVWYRRLSRRWQRLILVVLIFTLLGKACSNREHVREPSAAQKAEVRKALSEIGQKFDTASTSTANQADLAKVGAQVAAAMNRELGEDSDSDPDVLAVPFTAPADDTASTRFAGTVFASSFGQLSMAEPGKVALAKSDAEASQPDPLKLARARSADKVLFGAVSGTAGDGHLDVTLEASEDGKVLWSGRYPVKGSDPEGVAADILSHVHPAK
jgi:TIR domain